MPARMRDLLPTPLPNLTIAQRTNHRLSVTSTACAGRPSALRGELAWGTEPKAHRRVRARESKASPEMLAHCDSRRDRAANRLEHVTLTSVQVFAKFHGNCNTMPAVSRLRNHRYPSSGRSERLMRVTTGSHARFSSCGYTRSKQWMAPGRPREKLHRL